MKNSVEDLDKAFAIIIEEMKELRGAFTPSMQKDVDAAIDSLFFLEESMISLKALKEKEEAKKKEEKC
jgi:hypothetical protein